jgi:glycosyltransferase involved in cell wall biosynthesis
MPAINRQEENNMKISILVPVYGVEAFIEACAEALFEQTYDDLEFIFVDDCTPDRSIEILRSVIDRYPQRKQQVHILRHDHNRGLGAARSSSLQAATGDFVMYADSDDIMSRDAVEKLFKRQQETGADIVSGAYQRLFADGRLSEPILPFHGNKDAMLRLMLAQNTIEHHVWGRLVRRSLHADGNIDFVEGINMAEDYSVMPRLLYHASSHATIDDVVTLYRENTTGTFFNWLNLKNIPSYLGANRAVGQYLSSHDTKRQYSFPFELGLFNARYHALRIGLTPQEINTHCPFPATIFLFRCCNLLFFHRPTKRLLRWTYLLIKHLYVKHLQ